MADRALKRYTPGLGKTVFVRDDEISGRRRITVPLAMVANGTRLTALLNGKAGRTLTLERAVINRAVKPSSAAGTILFRLFKHPVGAADVAADDGNSVDLEGGTAKEGDAVTLSATAANLKLTAAGDAFFAQVVSNNADAANLTETSVEITYRDDPS